MRSMLSSKLWMKISALKLDGDDLSDKANATVWSNVQRTAIAAVIKTASTCLESLAVAVAVAAH